MLMTTTRSDFLMVPAAINFSSAAKATPVCGQLNMPVLSARAAASASSVSLACSTTPSYSFKLRIALATLIGFPIWMAEARVVVGTTGSKFSNPFW